MRCEICRREEATVRRCDMAGISAVCSKCEHLVLEILKDVVSMAFRYAGPKGTTQTVPVVKPPEPAQQSQIVPAGFTAERPTDNLTGPPCERCGTIMIPNGKCYLCPNCGHSGGCGG